MHKKYINLSNKYLRGFCIPKSFKGGSLQMKKVKVIWRTRRICTQIAIKSGMMYAGGLTIMILFSEIPDRQDVWLMSSTVASLCFFFVIACIYVYIAIKAKKTKILVYYEEKIIIKGKRKICYNDYDTTQTTLIQKIFKLITIEFIGENGKIVLKDVSKKLLEYV